jgi:glc operon protein GlcG
MPSPRPARTTALTSAAAAAALSAAQVEALAMGVSVTVAVLDAGGAVKSMSRMDGAPLISIETATRKAYAAVAIGMPPDDFFEAIKDDPAAVAGFATRPGLALIAGGLPVVLDGTVVAGLGVAGAMTGAEDRRIAEHAAAAMVAEISGSSTPGPGHSWPGEESASRVRRRRSADDHSTSHDSSKEPTS